MSLGNRNQKTEGTLEETRFRRRDFLRLAELTAISAIVAACAPAAPQPTPAPAATQAPATPVPAATEVPATPVPATKEGAQIRFLYWDDFEGPYQSEAYMKLHPDVKIETIPYLDESGKLDAMIAAGNPPDILVIGGDDIYKYTSMKALLNFQPIVDADKEFDISIYFPEAVIGWKSPDGDLYGLGPDFGMELLYYNKKLFDEAGLAVPTKSWTWQDMQQAAKTLTKGEGATKQYGSVAFWGPSQQLGIVWENGGEIFSADRRKCLMDSPEAIGALAYVNGYVHDGLAPAPQEVSALGMELGPFFATGRVGVTPGGHWYFRYMAEMDWGVTVYPQGKKPGTYLYQAIWSASNATKFPEVCWDLIKFSCTPEWSEKFCVYVGGMPTIVDVAKRLAASTPEQAKDLKHFEQKEAGPDVVLPGVEKVWKAMFDGVQSARRPLVIPGITEINTSVWTPALDPMWTGETTPEQVCRAIAEGANKILDREWAKT